MLAAVVLYETGKEMGARIARNSYERVMDPEEAIREVPKILAWIGIDSLQKGNEIYVMDAVGLATSDEEGVCHFERGLVAGIMSGLTRAPWEGIGRLEEDGCVIKLRIGGLTEKEAKGLEERLRNRV
ncbi:hypothetical protein EYM_00335 [Ignicoccus islandicus DSM 13165]|uniref:Uncharacterized protein n=1 Tax=Ignicoccus islandicus DSM 13165 TaxID=940295 RepID=A0A0U3E2F8_9CREN|nr:hypothetical protein [Ignicoccus islandicus]ALU12107.1 hypothetical protein EYM_00335 [Ignicoccus islandicus DSM 13165]